ncbi:MAG: hypothetical protein EA392_11940 [Cryomorphaceae bacterium]|nr:MAG: hypothetical protein EA392_11940 [Cryomorphaceae bacterium]
MYRGSGGLLQKSHKIHDGAVELIKGAIPSLRCSPDSEIDEGAIEKIIQLKERLEKHYKGFKFVRLDKNGKKSEPVINPTETLMSKIMLGSLGCVPAFDRYFIAGMKVNGLENRRFNEKGLQELFGFLASDQCELQKARIIIKDKSDTYYSDMKILDMYFWQKGFEKEIKGNGAK